MTSKVDYSLVGETRIPLGQDSDGPDTLVVAAFSDATIGFQWQWDGDGPTLYFPARKARQLAAQLLAAAQASEDGAA